MDANVKNGHIVIHFIIPGKEKRATTLKVCRFNLIPDRFDSLPLTLSINELIY